MPALLVIPTYAGHYETEPTVSVGLDEGQMTELIGRRAGALAEHASYRVVAIRNVLRN